MSAPLTQQTLLLRLRDHTDAVAWAEFIDLYTPIVYSYSLSKNLDHADASDVVQDVMQSVSTAIRTFDYDPDKGTFRSWLYTVTRNRINQHFRTASRRPQTDGDPAIIDNTEASPTDHERWESRYRQQMFTWAANAVRPEFSPRIWDAFWRTAVLDHDPADVAADLDMTRPAVYVAKSRCVQRIRDKIKSAAGERWESSASDQ